MKVKTKQEAWNEVDKMIDWDYDLDTSANAPYSVYRDPHNSNNYICDLGDRLEVNTSDGKSVNIWFNNQLPKFAGVEIDLKSQSDQASTLFTITKSSLHEAYHTLEQFVSDYDVELDLDLVMCSLSSIKNGAMKVDLGIVELLRIEN